MRLESHEAVVTKEKMAFIKKLIVTWMEQPPEHDYVLLTYGKSTRVLRERDSSHLKAEKKRLWIYK